MRDDEAFARSLQSPSSAAGASAASAIVLGDDGGELDPELKLAIEMSLKQEQQEAERRRLAAAQQQQQQQQNNSSSSKVGGF